jgi:hypothetical protein
MLVPSKLEEILLYVAATDMVVTTMLSVDGQLGNYSCQFTCQPDSQRCTNSVPSGLEFVFYKYSTNTDTHTHISIRSYKYMHTHPTPTITSERLSWLNLEIHEVSHP